ncbi:MAG: homocysteine S-methyltransferase family protein [Acidimicrobiales bacterium]
MESLTNYEAILGDLASGKKILIDGGTGTEIELRGVPPIDDAWSSTGALDGPDVVREVHEAYLRAGARIVISNTFSTSHHALVDAGIEEKFEELNRQGVELARRARDEAGAAAVVAAGITHWSWTRIHPPLELLREKAIIQAKIMADAGAEMFILEMMTDLDRMSIILDACRQTGLPIWVGFSCDIDGPDSETPGTARLLGGPTLAEGVAALDGHDVPVALIMHTEVEDIDGCLDSLDEVWNGPTGVYAHSGHFVNPNWIFNGVISPTDYADHAQRWLDRGVQVIGGCCGIGPEHIEALQPMV